MNVATIDCSDVECDKDIDLYKDHLVLARQKFALPVTEVHFCDGDCLSNWLEHCMDEDDW